eukprot:scaffold6095_cov92-Isochrysis_galbana.AAC.1
MATLPLQPPRRASAPRRPGVPPLGIWPISEDGRKELGQDDRMLRHLWEDEVLQRGLNRVGQAAAFGLARVGGSPAALKLGRGRGGVPAPTILEQGAQQGVVEGGVIVNLPHRPPGAARLPSRRDAVPRPAPHRRKPHP